MNRLVLYFLVSALAFLLPQSIHADLLQLKNGNKLEGLFLRNAPGGFYFRVHDGQELLFKTSDIAYLKIGYRGPPLCLQLKDTAQEKKCNVLLYRVEGDQMLVASGEGHLQLERIPFEDIKNFRVSKSSQESSEFIARIPKGVVLELEKKNKKVKVKVLRQDADALLVEKRNGEQRRIKAQDIIAASFSAETNIKEADSGSIYDFIPGVFQYRQGRVVDGLAVGGSFGSSLLLIAYYYDQGQQAAAAGSKDPSVLLLNNQSYYREFEANHRRQRTAGYLAALVYIYHLLDMYYLNHDQADRFSKAYRDKVELFWSVSSSNRNAVNYDQARPDGLNKNTWNLGVRWSF